MRKDSGGGDLGGLWHGVVWFGMGRLGYHQYNAGAWDHRVSCGDAVVSV